MSTDTKSALVIFKEDLSIRDKKRLSSVPRCEVVIAPLKLREEIQGLGIKYVALDELVGAGSIYEASALTEELSRLVFPNNGVRVAKSVVFEGYELWWIHYNALFYASCLPFTQQRRLLAHLKDFQTVYLLEPTHTSIFTTYLHAHGCAVEVLSKSGLRVSLVSFGVLIQIVLTFLSLPFLIVQRHSVMFFIGDKFNKQNDYDARMSFIYEEARQRGLPFVEFVRSLESWKTVLMHAVKRKRPVIYSAAVASLGRFMSIVTFARRRRRQTIDTLVASTAQSKEENFRLLLATQYLRDIDSDIWAIRITKLVLRCIGVQVAFIPTATERNFHAVLGCKLRAIPTVGILHGVASLHYNTYDFLPAYDGEKTLSVDKYGLWSEWWKEYYTEKSRAYRKEQLYVSGPMRPLVRKDAPRDVGREQHDGPTKVLLVSEQLAVPEEILPYLEALMNERSVEVYMSFRPYRDGFELWLRQHHPDILEQIGEAHILRNGITDAVTKCDVVVGTHSTAVLEALFDLKPIVFFATGKWGDYFNLKGYHTQHTFYAESKEALIECVQKGSDIPVEVLKALQERFFGDPYRNGSKWVVDQLRALLQRRS